MRKINSVGYGGRVLLIAGALLFLLPVCLALFPNRPPVFALLEKISIAAGAILLSGFGVLLLIELQQDRGEARFYIAHKNARRPIGNGRYECQYCGNRNIRAEEKACPVCGVKFEDDTDGAGFQ